MNLNINRIIKQLTPFLIILLIAFAINSTLYIFLPKVYESSLENDDYAIEYKKYQLLYSFKDKNKEIKKVVEPKKEIKKEYKLISNILLKAIYSTSSNTGWIVIAENKSNKTHILSVSDSFKKYELKSIHKDYVIFENNNKEYKLSLVNDKSIKKYTTTKVKDEVKSNKIELVDDVYSIKKNILTDYIKTPAKIWKEISIKEIFKNGKIDGFKVLRVSKKSVFKDLGLMKNDIIKSVNNIKLNSYSDAFKVYKQIEKIENLNLIILRDGQELELEYEIK
ncbi:MAG: hypothetical protein U9Q20_06520 [Campylobacterota bacterium]|nr:hypothetical protein [Campylobacterota bacterium]